MISNSATYATDASFPDSDVTSVGGACFRWIALASLCIIIHVGIHFLSPYVHPGVDVYVLRPIFWMLSAGIVLWFLSAHRHKLWETHGFVPTAVTVALIQISVAVGLAILLGFGKSPYNHGAIGLITSVWFLGTVLVGREFARWYIVKSLERHGEIVSIAFTWMLFSVTSLPIHGYSQLMSGDTAFAYIGKLLLPAAAIQLLATYLSLRGGPLVSIAYLGTLTAFEWFSPILPDLTWPIHALIGVMVPLLALSLLESDGELDSEVGVGWSWIASAFLLVAVLWFNTGVFGVRPALVHGTSMLPTMETGDIAITRDVAVDDLQVGDVIRFRQGSRVVLHRIIEITAENGETVFIAQGDNNDAPDSPISASDVEGELALHVPKAGLPGIYFKQALNWVIN